MAGVRQYAVLPTLAAKVYNATGNGANVDLQGYVGPGARELKAVLSIASYAGTTPTCNVKMQDSDNGSSFGDISGAAFTEVGEATSEQTIHFRTIKRYVRAVVTLTGSGAEYGIYCGVVALDRNL